MPGYTLTHMLTRHLHTHATTRTHTQPAPTSTHVACHVFECRNSSQYVLTTIGQAFELRYKIYLHAPKAHPIQVGDRYVVVQSALAMHVYVHSNVVKPSLIPS